MSKKQNKTKIKIIISILAVILLISIIQIYQSIEIEEPNYNAQKTLYTQNEQTVENESEKSQTIADMIEETTKKVVGISKLKNTGATLLTSASEKDLGLGSGVIISDNGYILSNEHVTGSQYSKCYITLEDRTKSRRNSSMERHRPRPITNKNKSRKPTIYRTSRLK